MSLKERDEEGLSESFSVHLHSVTLTHEVSNTLTHMHIYTNIHKYRHIQIHENTQYKYKYTHMHIYTHKHQDTGKHSLRHNCIHILYLTFFINTYTQMNTYTKIYI